MRKQAKQRLAAWRKRLALMGLGGWALTILGLGSVGCSPEDAIKGAASLSDDKASARSFVIQPDWDSFWGWLPDWPH
jgi:hypothetical protein